MSREKRFNLSDIPGARENHVQYMMFCGVSSIAEAKRLAVDSVSDIEATKKRIREKRNSQRKST